MYEMGEVFEKAIRKGLDSNTPPKLRLYTKKFWTVMSTYVSCIKKINHAKNRRTRRDGSNRPAFCIPASTKSVPSWDVIFCLTSAGNDGQSRKGFSFQNFWPIVGNKSNLPPFPQSNKCHKRKRRTGGCTNDSGRFSPVP